VDESQMCTIEEGSQTSQNLLLDANLSAATHFPSNTPKRIQHVVQCLAE
jgi:hypothetical protein